MRQEGIPVAPAEREHAEALHVRAADMVVDAGQQLYFLGAVAAEQRVVDDEDVPARLARQRCDSLLDDGRAQVEGTPLEYRFERDEEDGHDRKAAQLVGIAASQDLADMEFSKELLNLGRSSFTGVMMIWYNIHGISPPFVL